MSDLMIPALTVLGVSIGIVLMWWMSPARNRPTEDEVVHLMSAAIAAERALKQLEEETKVLPNNSMLQARHEVAVHKARREASHTRWVAHNAGIRAGIIEDVCW